MRHSLLWLLLFGVSTAFMTGCGTTSTDTQQEEQMPELRSGTIERTFSGALSKGTHTLREENGRETYLRSKTENLNTYIGQELQVQGMVTTDRDGEDIMDVWMVTVLGAAEEDTQWSWVEDRFAGVGLSLSYPDALQAMASASSVVFTKEDATTGERITVTFAVDGTLGGRTLRTYLSTKGAMNDFEEVRLGQYSGSRRIGMSSDMMEFFLEGEGVVYRIEYSEVNPQQNWRRYFYEMMDTVRFGVVTEEALMEEEGEGMSDGTPLSSEGDAMPDTAVQQQVAGFIANNTSRFSESTTVRITGYSFVEGNYVYVTYTEEEVRKRVLFEYALRGDLVDLQVVGYFVAGETRDWERVDGENPAAGREQQVFATTEDGTLAPPTVIREGFRQYSGATHGYAIQLPANWYYRGMGGSGETVHQLGFSTAPLEEGNIQATLQVRRGELPSGGAAATIAGQPARIEYRSNEEGTEEVTVTMQGEDGRVYVLSGEREMEATFRTMLETVQPQ